LDALAGDQPRTLSYAHCRGMGPAVWSERARAALLERLDFSPEPVPLDAEVLACTPERGYVRETVEFASTRHHRIRGELLLSEGARRPLPAVLALHDHGGFYTHGREKLVEGLSDSPALMEFVEKGYEGRFWASELARRGYVALVTDVLGWGERRMPAEDLPGDVRVRLEKWPEGSREWAAAYNNQVSQATPALNQNANFAGVSWMGVVVWDDRRALEYLLSRPEVDAGRAACAGLSGGGWRSTHLFGAEPGLKAAAIAGWMARVGDQLLHESRCHLGLYTAPSVYRALDRPDIAAIGAPRPLMVLQCEQDRLFSVDSMRGACEDIRRVYEDWGHGERFDARFYDVPHCLNRQMQEEMFAWMDTWI
jgi:dienelactone hydrolase